MDSIRQYVISIISAAIICGIIKGMIGNGLSQGIIKILCGSFLAFTFIKPIGVFSFESINASMSLAIDEGNRLVTDGQNASRVAIQNEIADRISKSVAQKAKNVGAEITVEVIYSEDSIPVPIALEIVGEISPYAKVQLSHYILSEYGIGEEDIHWIG